MFIGCHVSISEGIEKAPIIGSNLGCECIQIFTRSPTGGISPKINENTIKKFLQNCIDYKIHNVYVHTPYYINLASDIQRIKYGSINAIVEELERANSIKAKYVMTHLGTAKQLGQENAIKQIIELFKSNLIKYNGNTKLLLENSAGAGKIIGDNLQELVQIINAVNSTYIDGICLDTQHMWASGYDLHNFEDTMNRIDREIGFDKIKLIHINNSLTEYNSHKDRHANLKNGLINIDTFKYIVKFANSYKIDLICETEYPGIIKDINILKEFRNKL